MRDVKGRLVAMQANKSRGLQHCLKATVITLLGTQTLLREQFRCSDYTLTVNMERRENA